MLAGVGGAFAFGDDEACVGVVVCGFLVGFFEPLGGLEASAVVFAFQDDACAVGVSDVGYVAFVCCPGFHFAVDAVVQVLGEVVGDVAFEARPGLLGGLAGSSHREPPPLRRGEEGCPGTARCIPGH